MNHCNYRIYCYDRDVIRPVRREIARNLTKSASDETMAILNHTNFLYVVEWSAPTIGALGHWMQSNNELYVTSP